MSRDAGVLPDVSGVYESAAHDPDFTALMGAFDSSTDAALAELIEADGRHRMAQGRPVDLARYLAALPDLPVHEDLLDAAIDVSLRCLAGGSRVGADAVKALVQSHPDLEHAIRESATLHSAVWSTTGLRAGMATRPPKPVPCDFGPLLPSGQRRYQLQSLLGQGGFGQVYLALDRQLSEEGHTALVAIKILVASDFSPLDRQRLIEEATKVRRISHPNVVQVMDRGVTEQNEDFIVYEYMDGGDLSASMDKTPTLAVRHAAGLLAKVARGVHAAHSAGVIHCDLKPGNIMMTAAGEPKIADFGIAIRLNDRQTPRDDLGGIGPIGSVAFISPEQYRREDGALSVPSDVYALGGILHLLLTGVLPNGSTLDEIAKVHDAKEGRRASPLLRPHRPEVDRDLEAICRRAMAVNADDRYHSAAALADDLERWLNLEPIAWTKPGAVRVLRLWARRKPALAAAVVLIALLLVSGTAVALRFASLANQRAIDAAIAKFKLEQEQKEKALKVTIGKAVGAGLEKMNTNYRFSTEALTHIFFLEHFFGPTVLDMPEVGSVLWKSRIATVRKLVQFSSENGRGEEMEALFWESALGFWLVCDKDYAEAEPLLAENIRKWSAKLAPDDSWLTALHAVAVCCKVNRYIGGGEAKSRNAHVGGGDAALLSQLETELRDAEQAVARTHRGTPIHFLVFQSIIDLYGPSLMNLPDRAAQLEGDLKALKDATNVKSARQQGAPPPPPPPGP